MNQIMKEIGAALLACIVGVFLIGVLDKSRDYIGTGLLSVLENEDRKEMFDFSGYQDSIAVSEWNERAEPKIYRETESNRYYAAEAFNPLSAYVVIDADEQTYNLYELVVQGVYPDKIQGCIDNVLNSADESIMHCFDAHTGQFNVETPGVYRILVRLTDCEQKESIYSLTIVVDERRT